MVTDTIAHSWIIDALSDHEAYAELHDQPKVATLIYAAKGAVKHALMVDFSSYILKSAFSSPGTP